MKKLIGYWIRDFNDTRYCAPQELVGNYSQNVKDRVVGYLKGGKTAMVYRGFSWCRFGCESSDTGMGTMEFTDGVWQWPEGLAHYIEKHDVLLPEEFISNALSKEPIVRDVRDLELENTRAMDDFWLDWCNKHANGTIRIRINQLKDQADKEAERAGQQEELKLIQESEKREQDIALSDRVCMWAGCERNTPEGTMICLWHQHKGSHDEQVEMAIYYAYNKYFRKALELKE